ncbi:uncharacterized protein K452DRAFT_229802, partial [Aplosporella prunicola CBS 121167]
LIYGYIFCFFGSLAMCASISEMASMYPTSGGQYHWVALMSPPRWAKFLSWFTGWVSVLGWQANCASACYLTGSMIQGLLVLNDPGYPYKRWHATLIMYAVLLFSLCINTVGVRFLPAAEGVILILHVLGFFAILIPLVHLAPISSASFVFTDFIKTAAYPEGLSSGYPDGLNWLVGLLTGAAVFLGFDGSCHMAEEVKNASLNVPRSMFFTIFLNGALGFGMLLTILFSVGDWASVLASPTGWPFLELLHAGVQSRAGATAMGSIILAMIFFATFGYVASASRQLWAFARDRGMPFSRSLRYVEPRLALPLPAIALTATVTLVLGLVNVGSSTAFNAFVSLIVASLFTSYIISISLLLRARLCADGPGTIAGGTLPAAPWRMGRRVGVVVNVVALAYCVLIYVLSFFPTAVPHTTEDMNWAVVMYVGVIAFGLVYYALWGRKQYDGPVMERQFAEAAGAGRAS